MLEILKLYAPYTGAMLTGLAIATALEYGIVKQIKKQGREYANSLNINPILRAPKLRWRI